MLARACTEGGGRRRGGRSRRRHRRAQAQHNDATPAQATCASRAGLPRRRGRMGHTPSRHAAAPLLPVAPTVRLGSSARLRAKLQESCPLPSAVEVSRSCGLRGRGGAPAARGCPGHLREGLGCPSRAPIPSWGTLLSRRFGGCRRRHRAALRRREPPFERYEPEAEGCLWA